VITDHDLDRVLATWLAEGTELAPAEDVEVALRRVDRTRQRNRGFASRARGLLPSVAGRYLLTASLVLVAVVGAWTLFGSASGRIASASIDAGDFPWARPDHVADAVAFVALLPPDAPEGIYWRAATYDRFELSGWSQSGVRTERVPSGEPLLGASAEAPIPDQTANLTVTVLPDAYRDGTLVSPGTPVRVDADATVHFIGSQGWLAGVEVPHQSYTVEARLPRLVDDGVISDDALRHAGQDYPPDLVAAYTGIPPGALGPEARRLLTSILASTPAHDPYDLAVAVEAYLRDPGHFTYSTDLTRVPCDTASIVECFARTRQGYCLHYASTMAILLRAANPGKPIPTRLVQGFLPGDRTGTTETVHNRSAHAWVEVYFPGYGWIPFDPTGGGVGRPVSTGTVRAP
jgi:transglutaminase-like putative cysteine protease